MDAITTPCEVVPKCRSKVAASDAGGLSCGAGSQRRRSACIGEFSPALVSSFLVDRAPVLGEETRRDFCGQLRVFLRFCHRERITPPLEPVMRTFIVFSFRGPLPLLNLIRSKAAIAPESGHIADAHHSRILASGRRRARFLLRLGLNVCGCLANGSRVYRIELDADCFNQASARLARVKGRVAAKRLSPFIPTLRR